MEHQKLKNIDYKYRRKIKINKISYFIISVLLYSNDFRIVILIE